MLLSDYFWRAFKAEFFLLSKVNSADSMRVGILVSIIFVSAHLTPLLLSVSAPASVGWNQYLFCFTIIFFSLFLITTYFKKNLHESIQSLATPPQKARIVVLAFMLISMVVFVELSSVSFLLTCFAYLIVGSIPLDRLIENPRKAG